MNLIDEEDGWDRFDECPEPDCTRCHDTGKVPAMDGYHEYLGYTDMPCSCAAGMKWVGMLGPSNPPWDS